MRIVIIFLASLLSTGIAFGQFTVKQTLGSSNTNVVSKGGLSSDSGFIINPVYADTAAANSGKMKFYPGGLIRTAANELWFRNAALTQWIQLGTGSGGGGTGNIDAVLALGGRLTAARAFSGANQSITVDSARWVFNIKTSNPAITFYPNDAREIWRIKRPTAYTGGMDFTMNMANIANGDGTYNSPVVMGFNQYGTQDPAYGGNYLSMEPDYRPGGAKYKEWHYEVYHPYSSGVSSHISRLMSSTYIERDSIGNSSNQWDFRGSPFNLSTTDDLPYASFIGIKSTGEWSTLLRSPNASSGIKFQGNGVDAQTFLDASPTLQDLSFRYWAGVYFGQHVRFTTDNTHDIGETGSGFRPRYITAGTAMITPLIYTDPTTNNLLFKDWGAGTTRMSLVGATGNLLLGTTTDIPSSLLTLSSTAKGILIPRMISANKLAISSPATGLLVFDTDSSAFSYYTGAAWAMIGAGGGGGSGVNIYNSDGTVSGNRTLDADGKDLTFVDLNNFNTSGDSSLNFYNEYAWLFNNQFKVSKNTSGITLAEHKLFGTVDYNGHSGTLSIDTVTTSLSHLDTTIIFAGKKLRLDGGTSGIYLGNATAGSVFNYRNNVGEDSVLTTDIQGKMKLKYIAAGGSGWGLTGNAGTTAGTNFLGTTDNIDLVIKADNTERVRVEAATGNVGIGTPTPASRLHVVGDYFGTGAVVSSNYGSFNGVFSSTVSGGSGSGANLTLQSTSDATKGKILFGTSAYDEVNNRLGIATASPTEKLHIVGKLRQVDGSQTAGHVLTSDANGVGTWTAPAGGGVSDGDKGDITVSSSGTVWTIDNLAVTNAKINDVAWSKITSTPTTISGYGLTDAAPINNPTFTGNLTVPTVKITSGSPGAGKVLTSDADGDATWETAGAGSGDVLSDLVNTEISITTTATATISTLHVCSGTTADYTVTLPAVSGNTGKFIGFRMSSALTKLVTLDGASSETIDGALTRIMWANETAILYCNGTTWTKIGGKSIAMVASMSLSAGAAFGGAAWEQIPLNVSDVDNTGMMVSTGSNQINIKRGSRYVISGGVGFAGSGDGTTSLPANVAYGISAITKNNGGTPDANRIGQSIASGLSGGFILNSISRPVSLATSDYIKLSGINSVGNTVYYYSGQFGCTLNVQEIVEW